MDRYLNVTEARKGLLDLVEQVSGGDRVVITKHGQPRAVLVSCERLALLEDLAWVLQDPGRREPCTKHGKNCIRTSCFDPSNKRRPAFSLCGLSPDNVPAKETKHEALCSRAPISPGLPVSRIGNESC